MMALPGSNSQDSPESSRSNEQGWALLGLLLTLGVMSIVLTSALVPNVQMQVQRDKEAEMLYRGDQMAQGIARYYARGVLAPLSVQLLLTSPFGPLTDLTKLRDGVTLGVREIKFVRPSAMIDPMNSAEWEPIRARDPRIMKFLQAWLVATQTVDINAYREYFLIAGPPQKSAVKKTDPAVPIQPPGGAAPGQPVAPNPGIPGSPGNQQVKRPGQTSDDDDDDDDDDVPIDPLARLFQSGSPGPNSSPIVAVAPRRKGKATSQYFGLDNYEDWIFIYIPRNIPNRPTRVSQ
jgi:type II secretory pathway pseudopilin PulG